MILGLKTGHETGRQKGADKANRWAGLALLVNYLSRQESAIEGLAPP